MYYFVPESYDVISIVHEWLFAYLNTFNKIAYQKPLKMFTFINIYL